LELQLTGMNDAELVRATVAGDREAYAALVRRHASRIYAVCLAVLHDPDDSQDAAQDALYKGLKSIGSLHDGSQFAAWITRIAQNLCRDKWRTEKRRQELLEQRSTELAPESESPPPDITDALEELPDEYRTPLMLYYFDGQSSENVARALGLTRAGASTRIARARRALRGLLEKRDG
jgi:RNA polymerase sigma-70 factor (ECF subfamily)